MDLDHLVPACGEGLEVLLGQLEVVLALGSHIVVFQGETVKIPVAPRK
jgi:hypothetical protein